MNLRHKEILNYLELNGSATIKELTSTLYVSDATIRRDLASLERIGALKRTFGGAKAILDRSDSIPLFIRESLDSKEKKEICGKAAGLIKDGNTVFIDGSSTAQHMINYIKHLKDITVVTNSIKTAELTCQNHIKTYCTGGLLLENSLVCMGPKSIEFAQSINTDLCFISCKGVTLDGKFSDTFEDDTAIRKIFLKNSTVRVMLITGNKFGNSYLHTLCHADEVDHIFSNVEIPSSITEKLRSKKV